MMAHQRVAGGGAIALHHVEHASRDPGFQRQLAQTIGGQRRQLGHFQHRGIPQRQARRHLPGRGHKRHVPRRHQRAHANRLHEGIVKHLVIDRIGLAVHLLAYFGEKFEVMRRPRDQHVFGLVDRQAGIGGFHRRDLRDVLIDQIPQAAHQARALFHRQVSPLREGLFRRRYRLVDFGFAAGGDFSQYLAGGRVGGMKIVCAGNVFTVDPMVNLFHDSVSSYACWLMIWLTRRPTPSTSTITSSPGTTSDSPFGVPVAIMSPGCRVINSLK